MPRKKDVYGVINIEGSVADYVGVRVSGHIVVTVVAGLCPEINSE